MSRLCASEQEKLTLLDELAQIIKEFEGKDLLVLDVRSFSSLTDYVLIADFSVSVQMQAAYKKISELLKECEFYLPKNRLQEGSQGWQVVDAGCIICHLMKEEARNFYELEKLWDKAKILSKLD